MKGSATIKYGEREAWAAFAAAAMVDGSSPAIAALAADAMLDEMRERCEPRPSRKPPAESPSPTRFRG